MLKVTIKGQQPAVRLAGIRQVIKLKGQRPQVKLLGARPKVKLAGNWRDDQPVPPQKPADKPSE
jgi:hypothetical protein